MKKLEPIREARPNEIRDNVASAKTVAEHKKWQVIYLSVCYEVDIAFISRVTGCSVQKVKDIMNKYRKPLKELNRWDVGRQFGKVKLSERQLQLAQLIATGKTTVEIGKTLGISPRTIEHHRKNLYTKLNISKVTELVAFAIRHKIIA